MDTMTIRLIYFSTLSGLFFAGVVLSWVLQALSDRRALRDPNRRTVAADASAVAASSAKAA